jgi:hypothetical protein
MNMEDIDVYELRWKTLIQKLVNAREYSLRTDIDIQHVINLLAQIEQQYPDHKPEDVAPIEEAE